MAGLPPVADFISQSTFEQSRDPSGPSPLPRDALGHEALSRTLLDRVRLLPPGAVIALQAGWGEGKTDVLARAALRTWQAQVPGFANEAIWINPWQYGTPDLLSPLVLALLRRGKELEKKRKLDLNKLRDNLMVVARAGVSYGLKAASVTVPAVAFAEASMLEAEKFLRGLLEADKPPAALDPVAGMAQAFRQAVDTLLSPEEREAGGRLLVCVDDLDRCMPDRQVALLQALCFLTSAGAPASFVVALDPTLARQAVLTHYRSAEFDPDRYLDKMFHLRLNLPARTPEAVSALLQARLDEQILLPGAVEGTTGTRLLRDAFGSQGERLHQEAGAALVVRELRNPRILTRLVSKLLILAQSELAAPQRQLGGLSAEDLRWLVLWTAMAERWPGVRAVFQGAGRSWAFVLDDVRQRYVGTKLGRAEPGRVADIERLPQPGEAPELVQIFAHTQQANRDHLGGLLQRIDRALVAAGL